VSDVIYLRGPGGGVFEFTPPLSEHIAKQYDAGDLVQVNADGSPYEDTPAPRRSRKAAQADA
jgi:hypothetical protein